MYASMVEAAQAPWWSSKPVDDEKSSSSFFPSVNSLFGQAAGRKKDRAPPDSFAKRASDLFALETREERKEKDSDDDVAPPRPRAAAPAAEIVLTALPADDGDDASDGPGVEDVRISVGLPDNDSLRTASPPESGSDGGDSDGGGDDVMLIHLEDEDDEADRTAGNECWTCPTCTFTNVREAGAGDFGTCSVCESPRPEEADVFVASPRALEFDAPSPAKQRRGSGIFKRSAGADRLAALLSMDIDGGDPSPAENAWADVATKTPDDAADAVPGDLMEDEDAQIAYGVAVSLLVSGLAKKDLAAALVGKGWSDIVARRVAKDLDTLGANLSRGGSGAGSGSGGAGAPSTPGGGGDAPSKSPDCVAQTPFPPSDDNETVAKFKKMLKMGIPAAAVEAKMKAERCSKADIDAALRGGAGGAAAAAPAPPAAPADDDAAALAPYLKMRKFGVTVEGVLSKMAADDVDAGVVERFRAAHGRGRRRRRATIALHWEKMDGAANAENSVWATPASKAPEDGGLDDDDDDAPGDHAALDHEDVAMLNDIFAAKESQNMTIALSKFKRAFKGDFDLLWVAVAELSPRLLPDALERLQAVLPTRSECDSVLKHVAAADDPGAAEKALSTAESFVLSAAREPMHARYLDAASSRAAFAHHVADVERACGSVTTAAAILVKSRGLTLILQRILAVGNVMNAGTKKGDARGIRLGSLLAIVKTKGRDRRTTVLDYVVQGLLKRGHGAAMEEVVRTLGGPVAAAARVPIGEHEKAVGDLRPSKRLDDGAAGAGARRWRAVARLRDFTGQAERKLEYLSVKHLGPMGFRLKALCEYFGESTQAAGQPTYVFETMHAFLAAFADALRAAQRAQRDADRKAKATELKAAAAGPRALARAPRKAPVEPASAVSPSNPRARNDSESFDDLIGRPERSGSNEDEVDTARGFYTSAKPKKPPAP
ncbi:hypothetical protein JL722_1875 [Aureococcus anophagefferens]|nr:hypothetical protein JL722_1875 [Aureococcus anophagefferens]